jgi:membrane dipeptidase
MSKLFYCLFIVLPFGIFAQSYQKLHDKAIVSDTHNDVLSTVTMKGLNIENDLTGKSNSDIERFKKGGVDVQVFSIFCDERFGKDTAFKYANTTTKPVIASHRKFYQGVQSSNQLTR